MLRHHPGTRQRVRGTHRRHQLMVGALAIHPPVPGILQLVQATLHRVLATLLPVLDTVLPVQATPRPRQTTVLRPLTTVRLLLGIAPQAQVIHLLVLATVQAVLDIVRLLPTTRLEREGIRLRRRNIHRQVLTTVPLRRVTVRLVLRIRLRLRASIVKELDIRPTPQVTHLRVRVTRQHRHHTLRLRRTLQRLPAIPPLLHLILHRVRVTAPPPPSTPPQARVTRLPLRATGRRLPTTVPHRRVMEIQQATIPLRALGTRQHRRTTRRAVPSIHPRVPPTALRLLLLDILPQLQTTHLRPQLTLPLHRTTLRTHLLTRLLRPNTPPPLRSTVLPLPSIPLPVPDIRPPVRTPYRPNRLLMETGDDREADPLATLQPVRNTLQPLLQGIVVPQGLHRIPHRLQHIRQLPRSTLLKVPDTHPRLLTILPRPQQEVNLATGPKVLPVDTVPVTRSLVPQLRPDTVQTNNFSLETPERPKA